MAEEQQGHSEKPKPKWYTDLSEKFKGWIGKGSEVQEEPPVIEGIREELPRFPGLPQIDHPTYKGFIRHLESYDWKEELETGDIEQVLGILLTANVEPAQQITYVKQSLQKKINTQKSYQSMYKGTPHEISQENTIKAYETLLAKMDANPAEAEKWIEGKKAEILRIKQDFIAYAEGSNEFYKQLYGASVEGEWINYTDSVAVLTDSEFYLHNLSLQEDSVPYDVSKKRAREKTRTYFGFAQNPDIEGKKQRYAAVKIPLYLLIADPNDPLSDLTIQSDPKRKNIVDHELAHLISKKRFGVREVDGNVVPIMAFGFTEKSTTTGEKLQILPYTALEEGATVFNEFLKRNNGNVESALSQLKELKAVATTLRPGEEELFMHRHQIPPNYVYAGYKTAELVSQVGLDQFVKSYGNSSIDNWFDAVKGTIGEEKFNESLQYFANLRLHDRG